MQHRRSIFLIDRPFQMRFAFYVCSWLFALSFVYPLIIYNLFDYFMKYLALDPMGPTLMRLHEVRGEIIWLLVIFQLIFMVVTFLISIFVSHRIAGPLYKLRKTMQSAKSGGTRNALHFRKKDHFQNIADDYNEMMNALHAALDKSRDSIAVAITQLEKSGKGGGDIEAVLTSLRDAKETLPH